MLALLMCFSLNSVCAVTISHVSKTQERVSNIYPEDLMQIVSHMDSLDNHKVYKKGCGGKKKQKIIRVKNLHNLSTLCARKADIF